MSLRRYFLQPFAVCYGLGTRLRNLAYDRGWLRSFSFDFPVVVVGNLQVGGTGKTPCVELLIRTLQTNCRVAVLSRGYGRKTSGYLLAGDNAKAEDIGDEPLLLKSLHPEVPVAVGEQRVAAIPALLHDEPETRVVLCDDAFQHRPLRGGLNLLLCPWDKPYTRDRLLPAGNLRESASGARRAQGILFTGCPEKLTSEERNAAAKALGVLPHQRVFFATNVYTPAYRLGNRDQLLSRSTGSPVLLLTGIARPKRLLQHLQTAGVSVRSDAQEPGINVLRPKKIRHLSFPDHHAFQERDFSKVRREFSRFPAEEQGLILTTEKDAMRLQDWADALQDLPIYVQPLQMRWLDGVAEEIELWLLEYIRNTEIGRPEYSTS